MRRTTICAALCAAALTSACAQTPAPVAIGNYCAIADRVELRDLCPDGVIPSIVADGWGSCSLPTRRDAIRLKAEADKHDDQCGGDDG